MPLFALCRSWQRAASCENAQGTDLKLRTFLCGFALAILSVLQAALACAHSAVRTSTESNRAASQSSGSKSLNREHLILFIKVWGFLKYHHPAATTGRLDWDREFLQLLPGMLSATDQEALRARLVAWIDALGTPSTCNDCVAPPAAAAIPAPVDWIYDQAELGTALSSRLRGIYANRLPGTQYYVALKPNVGNVVFDHEQQVPGFPNLAHRLLAAARYWNAIEYWSPNRDEQGIEWQQSLAQSIDAFEGARDQRAYELAVLALAARLRDGHANTLSTFDLLPPLGNCDVPISLTWAQNKLVVASIDTPIEGLESLRPGDVIDSVEGKSIGEIVDSRRRFYAYSTEQAFRRDIAYLMLRGSCAPTTFTAARRESKSVYRLMRSSLPRRPMADDMPGPSFRLLEPDIFYLKLSSIRAEDLERYLSTADTAKGLIVDLRGYPSAFVVYALGQHFVAHDTPFAFFTAGDLSNPGAFEWVGPAVLRANASFASSGAGQFQGQLDVLIDAATQSQAEFTAMALLVAPNVKLVGSATAGSDGDVSILTLPGGLSTAFSGLGVFLPDKRPTQRIGLQPDIRVERTIEGIRQGTDEILQAALDDLHARFAHAGQNTL